MYAARIASYLNELEVRTMSGKPWYASTVRKRC
jgi:hypothetical protein